MTVSATPTSSTATPPADADAASPADERTLVRAVLAMGVGGFAIGTGEFVIMGLLPEVALDLGVSIPQAGHVAGPAGGRSTTKSSFRCSSWFFSFSIMPLRSIGSAWTSIPFCSAHDSQRWYFSALPTATLWAAL